MEVAPPAVDCTVDCTVCSPRSNNLLFNEYEIVIDYEDLAEEEVDEEENSANILEKIAKGETHLKLSSSSVSSTVIWEDAGAPPPPGVPR